MDTRKAMHTWEDRQFQVQTCKRLGLHTCRLSVWTTHGHVCSLFLFADEDIFLKLLTHGQPSSRGGGAQYPQDIRMRVAWHELRLVDVPLRASGSRVYPRGNPGRHPKDWCGSCSSSSGARMARMLAAAAAVGSGYCVRTRVMRERQSHFSARSEQCAQRRARDCGILDV